MQRTQIYLSDDENKVLVRESKKRGQSKSELIRKAIAVCYLGRVSGASLEDILRRSAGARKGAGDPVALVDSLRPGLGKKR